MKEQSLGHKLAEVNFRKKLTKQHLGQGNFYPNEPNHEEIFKILKERVSTSKRIFSELKKLETEFSQRDKELVALQNRIRQQCSGYLRIRLK